jgi:hypothetical protein
MGRLNGKLNGKAVMMRLGWQRTLAPLAILVAGAVGACSTAPGSNTTTPSATPTPATACPVGSWRSTAVTASTSVAGATIAFQGGSGVSVTIGADGAVTADFSSMQPIGFTADAAGVQVRGEIAYSGTIQGTVQMNASGSPSGALTTSSSPLGTSPSGTAGSPAAPTTTSGSAGNSAPWKPTGTVNRDNLRVTVRVSQPVAATVVDNLKVTDVPGVASQQAGNAVDLQPLLHDGQYTCEGNDKLTITTSAAGSNGPSVTWVLSRG